MNKLTSLMFGVWVSAGVSACGGGGDEGTGTGGMSGASSTSGGAGPGTLSSGGSTAKGGGAGAGSGGVTTTSGGSGGGGGSGGACDTACQKFVAAKCGDFATTSCSTACAPATTCTAESGTYYECVASRGAVSCDAEMQTTVAGCDTESRAFGLCALCEPATDDTACGTCNKGKCCPQFKAYASASDIDGFDACVSATTCTTQACVDGCVTMYPAAGKAYTAAVACQGASCGEQCYCAADPADTACATCLKTTCCDLVVPYLTASDGAQFAACIDPCTDQACVDACAAQFPTAGTAYDNLAVQCASTTCATDCG